MGILEDKYSEEMYYTHITQTESDTPASYRVVIARHPGEVELAGLGCFWIHIPLEHEKTLDERGDVQWENAGLLYQLITR